MAKKKNIFGIEASKIKPKYVVSGIILAVIYFAIFLFFYSTIKANPLTLVAFMSIFLVSGYAVIRGYEK